MFTGLTRDPCILEFLEGRDVLEEFADELPPRDGEGLREEWGLGLAEDDALDMVEGGGK